MNGCLKKYWMQLTSILLYNNFIHMIIIDLPYFIMFKNIINFIKKHYCTKLIWTKQRIQYLTNISENDDAINSKKSRKTMVPISIKPSKPISSTVKSQMLYFNSLFLLKLLLFLIITVLYFCSILYKVPI